MFKTTDYHYDLPDELIARYPAASRTASRLMVLHDQLRHCHFSDLPQFLNAGDLLVFNHSKVIKARLFGEKTTGGKIEALIERVLPPHHVLAHLKSSKSPKPESTIHLNGVDVKVLRRDGDLFVLEFPQDIQIFHWLEQQGEMPIPPYFQRRAEAIDNERYQTVYAKLEGSVAAPTAGLHFDEALLQQLKKQGVESTFVTLHVGAGTFQPVRVDDVTQHHMHKEWIDVSAENVATIQAAKARGNKVIAVGTTSVRALETAAKEGVLKPYQGDTDIFIYPGFQFKVIDGMITNFHLPESTLLMLVSAFAGYERIMNAYKTAVEEKYRFFSYGDAMLLQTVRSDANS